MRTFALILAALLALATSPANAQGLRAEALTEDERNAVILTLRIAGDDIDTLDEFATATTIERQAIIDEHQPRIAEAWAAQREAVQRGETPDMRVAMGSIWDARAALDDAQTQMLNDLALTLGEDRTEHVEQCVHRLYRMRTLDTLATAISGLGADPLAVAHDVGVPAALSDERAANFERAMLAYDKAIAEELRAMEELEREATIAFSVPGFDDEGPIADDYLTRTLELSADIKDAHRERSDAIASTLPPDLRDEWQEAWLRRAYPGVYAPHYLEAARDRLLDQTELPDEEREAVDAYTASLMATLARARTALREAIDDAEEGVTIDHLRYNRPITTDDLTDAQTRLSSLASQTREHLLTLIAEERHTLIPPLPEAADE